MRHLFETRKNWSLLENSNKDHRFVMFTLVTKTPARNFKNFGFCWMYFRECRPFLDTANWEETRQGITAPEDKVTIALFGKFVADTWNRTTGSYC
jgi:hypothetical protein